MASLTRRLAMKSLALAAAAGGAPVARAAPPEASEKVLSDSGDEWRFLRWARGIEGQRKADLGDGTFLNPIVPGNHPDPSILKDGKDYYLVFSTFDAYPALTIWHSRDLVNWAPVMAPLTKPIGTIWAPDIAKHGGAYYIYIPTVGAYRSIFVVSAPSIHGPWSEPVDLKIHGHIDPGHAVGEDGKRYLFLSGGDRIRLADDGLSTIGAAEHVYDPWHYPPDWTVESFSPEGPKIVRHGEYFYMITAVGGTAGPPTGHMVIAARSRSIDGPWENAPSNPIVRTNSATQKWWSRGHATPFEAPDGSWYLVYHGYENGYWTLGRQTLLDPIEWTPDGWFVAKGGDLSKPMPIPKGGEKSPAGFPLSDDFSSNRFGTAWSFYDPAPDEAARIRYEAGALVVKAKGTQPSDSSPLSFLVGDQAYEMQTEIELGEGAQAGVLLFYNRRLYCGLGWDGAKLVMHRYGLDRDHGRFRLPARRISMRIANDHHIVTIHTSPDGQQWDKFGVQMEVSGYHHNVAYDFLSLRPAIYVAGAGEARFRNLIYRAT